MSKEIPPPPKKPRFQDRWEEVGTTQGQGKTKGKPLDALEGTDTPESVASTNSSLYSSDSPPPPPISGRRSSPDRRRKCIHNNYSQCGNRSLLFLTLCAHVQ